MEHGKRDQHLAGLPPEYIQEIKGIIAGARSAAYRAVNAAMVEAYWRAGRRIVQEEQAGKERAAYGAELIKNLSRELVREFGAGFSERCLREHRQFYLTFPSEEIWHTVCAKLTWSHVRLIMRVTGKEAQEWYLKEAAENNWSVRTLDRNISTLYYQRFLASQVKEPVAREMAEKTEALGQDKLEFIKNPSVLEFLGLPANAGYTEADLEKAIIDHLQQFLLELRKGFAFVSRQHHIRTETADFYIDLVFYNFILKCFVLIDLKAGKITHQDIGQLDMYVRMFDDLQKREEDNPAIGILLCTETDKTIARYSVLNESRQLFAAKYMPYLPTEEELAAEIERQKEILKTRFGAKEGVEKK